MSSSPLVTAAITQSTFTSVDNSDNASAGKFESSSLSCDQYRKSPKTPSNQESTQNYLDEICDPNDHQSDSKYQSNPSSSSIVYQQQQAGNMFEYIDNSTFLNYYDINGPPQNYLFNNRDEFDKYESAGHSHLHGASAFMPTSPMSNLYPGGHPHPYQPQLYTNYLYGMSHHHHHNQMLQNFSPYDVSPSQASIPLEHPSLEQRGHSNLVDSYESGTFDDRTQEQSRVSLLCSNGQPHYSGSLVSINELETSPLHPLQQSDYTSLSLDNNNIYYNNKKTKSNQMHIEKEPIEQANNTSNDPIKTKGNHSLSLNTTLSPSMMHLNKNVTNLVISVENK